MLADQPPDDSMGDETRAADGSDGGLEEVLWRSPDRTLFRSSSLPVVSDKRWSSAVGSLCSDLNREGSLMLNGANRRLSGDDCDKQLVECAHPDDDDDDEEEEEEEEEAGEEENDVVGPVDEDQDLPYPGFMRKAFIYFEQTSPPRSWCLRLITWPYPFQFTISICCSSR